MNFLFKNIYGIKRRKYDMNIHKDMRIPVDIYQTNKKLLNTVQPKNTCKLEFADHLWLPFLDQLQSDIVVFATITFQVYNILAKKWKHGIGPNYIMSLHG